MWSLTLLAWLGILGLPASLAGAVLISVREDSWWHRRRGSRS